MRLKAVMAMSIVAGSVLLTHSAHGQRPAADPFAKRPVGARRTGGVIASAEYVDTPVTTIFRMISDLTGWSIVMSPEISRQPPRVNIWIKDLQPEQVLQEIAVLAGLVVDREGNTIKISSFEGYARRNGLAKKVVPLKYSKPTQVAQILSAFAAKEDRTYIQPDEAGRKIVLLVPKPLMESFVKLIREIDVPREHDKIEIIPFRHRNVMQVEPVIAAFVTGAGSVRRVSSMTPAVTAAGQDPVHVVAEPRLNVLLLRGASESVARIKALVVELDKPLDVEVIPYQLKYTSAKEAYVTLTDILLSDEGEAGKSRYRRLRVALSEQNNQIVVEAPAAEQARAAKLIEAIDRPLPPGSGGTRVYRLENASSAEVVKVLAELVEQESGRAAVAPGAPPPGQKGVHRVGAATPPADGAPSASSAPPKPSTAQEAGTDDAKQTNVLPAKVTEAPEINAVVIRASAAEHEEFAVLIKELDRPRDQVMLEVTVVTVRSSKGFELGLELGGAKLNGSGVQTVGFAHFGVGSADSATGRIRIASPAPPLGLNYALFNASDFSLVLKALQTVGQTRIAASPKILVQDNALAMISQVDEEPFEVVNQGDTTTTTTFGGFVEAGTVLRVIPHLSRGNWLRLEYEINSSSFGARDNPELPPPRLRREIQGVVRVPGDFMVALGGLVSAREEDRHAAVPWVSQIPLLGELFKERTSGSTHETLFVFIRPVALRDPTFRDLVHLSRTDIENAKLAQRDYPSNPLKLFPPVLATTTQPEPEERK